MITLDFGELDAIKDAIETWHSVTRVPRNYLGLSEIGEVVRCQRLAWYKMKGIAGEEPSGRLLRLFRTGEDTERNVIHDLKSIGLDVTCQQFEVEATQEGKRFIGHIDGIVSGLDLFGLSSKKHLLEIKSANGKRFAELQKINDYQKWGGPKYEAQIHIYGLLLELKRILVVVENKENCDLYFERIKVNENLAITTLRMAFDLWDYEEAPYERWCPRLDHWEAKFCSHRGVCWK